LRSTNRGEGIEWRQIEKSSAADEVLENLGLKAKAIERSAPCWPSIANRRTGLNQGEVVGNEAYPKGEPMITFHGIAIVAIIF